MKNRNTIQIMLMACLAGMAGMASADILTLEVNDDSWVNGNIPTGNYGSGTDTRLRYQNTSWGNNYALFKFDFSTLPANIAVNNVRMRFYTSMANWPGSTNFAPVAIFNNTQNWDESTVTFATAPTYDATAIETLDHFGTTSVPIYFTGTNTIDTAGWMEFESAGTIALVQGWADGTVDNFGISMWGTGDFLSDQRTFRPQTKEHPTLAVRPELIVDYTIIPEPATLGLVGVASVGLFMMRRFMSI